MVLYKSDESSCHHRPDDSRQSLSISRPPRKHKKVRSFKVGMGVGLSGRCRMPEAFCCTGA